MTYRRDARVSTVSDEIRLGADKCPFEEVGGVACARGHIFDIHLDYFLNGVQGRYHDIRQECVRLDLIFIVDLVQ